MTKLSLARTATVAIVSLALPWSARADALCEGLKAVVAEAPQNFAEVRGKPEPTTGYSNEPFLIPGAAPPPGLTVSCTAGEFPVKSNRYFYSCSFPGPSGSLADAKVSFASFIQRIETCLGLAHTEYDLSNAGDQGRLGAANRGPVELLAERAIVSLELGYPPHGGSGFYGIAIKPR